MRRFVVASILVCLSCNARAQTKEEWGVRITRCQEIKSDTDRLKCYDETISALRELSKQPAISVDEYLLDRKSLIGQYVGVTGQISCASLDLCFIAESASTFMQSAQFDATTLPREDRARLLHCTNIYYPCAGTVAGTVVGGFQTTIRADQIIWPPD